MRLVIYMKKIALLYLIILTACTQEASEFPVHDFNPLAHSYVENEIVGYLKLWNYKGKLEKQDSVRISIHGLQTDRIRVSGHWHSETNYRFDLLNRMTQIYHDSDIRYTYSISYVFKPEEGIMEQRWKDITSSDTIELWNHKYFYEESFNRPTWMIRLHGDLDTISTTYYSYSIYGIKEILEVGDMTTLKTSFVYNRDSSLCKVIKAYNDRVFEIDFISSKTGMIDSTVNEVQGTFYYEYF